MYTKLFGKLHRIEAGKNIIRNAMNSCQLFKESIRSAKFEPTNPCIGFDPGLKPNKFPFLVSPKGREFKFDTTSVPFGELPENKNIVFVMLNVTFQFN
jgi:hypothetical protein